MSKPSPRDISITTEPAGSMAVVAPGSSTQDAEAPTAARPRSLALRSGMVYTIASATPRAVGFALLPVFTRVLSPSSYGQLSVALSLTSVAVVIFALGFDFAVFRTFFRLEDDIPARERYVSSVWTFSLVVPWLMAAVCGAVLIPILGANHVLSSSRLELALICAAMTVGATTVPLVVLRAENRLRGYTAMMATNTVVSTALSLVFVVWIHGGVLAYLLSVIAANLASLVIAIRIVPFSLPRPFEKAMVKDTLHLSLPIVPHFVLLWALQLADRFLVATILGTAAAGLYSVASNLALPMFVIVLGFGQAFMPAYAQAGNSGNAKASLQHTIASQVGVMSVLCMACSALAPPAIHLLTDSRYSSAAGLAPWIVLGYGFQGFYAIPMNGITLYHGNTKGLPIVSGIGAGTNIGLIVWLAPKYGLEAVAIASAVGYAALLLGVSLFARYKGARLSYPWARIFVTLTIALVGYATCVLTSSDTDLTGFAIRLGWIAATTCLVGVVAIGTTDLANLRQRLRRSS